MPRLNKSKIKLPLFIRIAQSIVIFANYENKMIDHFFSVQKVVIIHIIMHLL